MADLTSRTMNLKDHPEGSVWPPEPEVYLSMAQGCGRVMAASTGLVHKLESWRLPNLSDFQLKERVTAQVGAKVGYEHRYPEPIIPLKLEQLSRFHLADLSLAQALLLEFSPGPPATAATEPAFFQPQRRAS